MIILIMIKYIKYNLIHYLMRRLIITLLLIVSANCLFAQRVQRYTISGYLRDSLSTENLIGATVYNRTGLAGTSSNQFGFYSLTLPAGEIELVYSYVGYNTQTLDFNLRSDTVININLVGLMHLQEVVIASGRTSPLQEHTQMSAINVPIAQIKSLPAFLGEVDMLKVLQLMPGIQSGGEGSSGLYVRGGGPDQNLFLLDGVPVYNVSHLFGFFSVFNADAVNSMEIIKGGFPARYGGRVSSVLDINLKEGNMQQFRGEGAVGIVSAKMTFEGPIIKDKTSFIVSGRRTYIDALAAPFIAIANSQSNMEKVRVGYYFYDLTTKINHRFSPRNRIFLSAYLGNDKFYFEEERNHNMGVPDYSYNSKSNAGLQWGNIITAFRWNYIITPRLFSNTTLTYSRYRFKVGDRFESTSTYEFPVYFPDEPPIIITHKDYFFMESQYNSGIQDWSGKIAFDYIPSPNHYVRFGASCIYHTFNPGVMAFRDIDEKHDFGGRKRHSWEYATYVEDDVKLTANLKVNIGLHWSAFVIENEFYNYLQPRIASRYLITPQLSVKASYSQMAQYVHLLTNSNIGLPTDLWVPTTPLLRPQTSEQIAIGLAQNFKENYELSLEGYYKTMNNVLEYKEGASFFDLDDSWERKIVQGKGSSYGMELFAQKKTGTFTGWVGYTLSWTDRQFDDLNEGKRFSYKYDRRHDLSLALMQRFGKEKKHEMSAVWVFGSGNCVTVPIGIYDAEHPMGEEYGRNMHRPQYEYGERNGYRMPPYHRLDLSLSFIKEKKWGERRWIIGVYNAYNRKNPFFIDVEQQWRANNVQLKFVQYSLFPIIPSISYNFKF